MITLKIIDSEAIITKNINKAISEHINKVLSNRKNLLLSRSKTLISKWIKSQPEINSLLVSSSESLAGQFGLTPGSVSSAINAIINSIENSIQVKFIPYNSNLQNGGLEINFQPNNFSNLLTLSEGHVNYPDGDLHWLNWLLTAGDTIIVVNYQYNPQTGLGRSGLGNMIPGGFFRVPPQFSGNIQDNFITRALIGQQQEQDISQIFKDLLS